MVVVLNEVERLRNTLHRVAAAAESLTDPSVLEVAEKLDRIVVEVMKQQEAYIAG